MAKTPNATLESAAQKRRVLTSTAACLPETCVPLNLPDQVDGLPTAPVDRGDETQDRFRYQWAMGVVLLAEGISGVCSSTAIWCEHHEDFLVELSSGKYLAIQVKTVSAENAKWSVSDEALVKSIKRFCALELNHGSEIQRYEFCSNAPIYIPGHQATNPVLLASSPEHLRLACVNAATPAALAASYKVEFEKLTVSVDCAEDILFCVFRKLAFRLGPPLRGYLDTLVAQVIPALPNCAGLPNARLQRISEELMRLVETASGIPTSGLDGVLSYIASNGRPENTIRGKCVTIEAAKTSIEQARQLTFRYVGYGDGLPIGNAEGQMSVLQRKMRNAFLGGQFEPMWLRVISTERRLMEKALADPDGFEAIAKQLEGTVLTECKDIEAEAALESDEKKRGLTIYKEVLQRLSDLAVNDPVRVENEPKDTLLGVAGMLSGSCRFAWGVPLDGEDNGA